MELFVKKRNTRLDEDALLIKKYQRTGDIKFLGDLYQKYMHYLYGLSLKYLKDRAAAKDAVMDLFEKLTGDKSLLVNEFPSFKSWLHVVMKNHCLMVLRKQQRGFTKQEEIKRGFLMENEEELHFLDGDNGEALNLRLAECLKKLKMEQKQCIEWFYFNQKCYKEIAAGLSLQEKKVKSHIQNAKRNLKICMEKSDEERA
jgi:RNA polymerase sigma-70 factor (ECF subfamily)